MCFTQPVWRNCTLVMLYIVWTAYILFLHLATPTHLGILQDLSSYILGVPYCYSHCNLTAKLISHNLRRKQRCVSNWSQEFFGLCHLWYSFPMHLLSGIFFSLITLTFLRYKRLMASTTIEYSFIFFCPQVKYYLLLNTYSHFLGGGRKSNISTSRCCM